MKKSTAGSILVEIAIGVSVMGVIAGLTMSHFSAQNKANYHKITKENIETVTMAVAAFLAKNYRLPKAASDYEGKEGNGEGKFVPYKALEISAKSALDGNTNPLIYVPEPDLTQNFNCIHFDSNMPSSDAFCEKNIIPTIAVTDAEEAEIAFVVDIQNGGINFQKDKTYVKQCEYTTWISRDMLLMKYLKSIPCKRIRYPEKTDTLNSTDNFLF